MTDPLFRELEGFFESPHDAPPDRLAVIYGYFDESGHESTDWVSLAGFVGNSGHWNAFVPKWKAGLGQRRTLHMSSLRWKQERTRKLLERLGPIPHACGLIGARGVVRVADYIDLIEGSDDEGIYTGYFACLSVIVPKLLQGYPKHERFELVFEQQNQYEEAANMAMTYFTDPALALGGPKGYAFTSSGLPRIAKWSFVPKGTTIMTDPADYLAYALREMHAHPSSQKARWCMPIFHGRRDGYGLTLTREQTRRTVRRAQARYASGQFLPPRSLRRP